MFDIRGTLMIMAGGMRTGDGVPLGERARRAASAAPPIRAVTTRTPGTTRPPMHCWVTTGEGRHPGVLLKWQHDGERWWGLTAFATGGPEPTLLTRLVPAEVLSPA